VILVERAQADEVRPVTFELDPPHPGQALDRYVPLEPLDLILGYARHRVSSKKASRGFMMHLT
jgi:hypothetical protein